jgi:hypothetical protein
MRSCFEPTDAPQCLQTRSWSKVAFSITQTSSLLSHSPASSLAYSGYRSSSMQRQSSLSDRFILSNSPVRSHSPTPANSHEHSNLGQPSSSCIPSISRTSSFSNASCPCSHFLLHRDPGHTHRSSHVSVLTGLCAVPPLPGHPEYDSLSQPHITPRSEVNPTPREVILHPKNSTLGTRRLLVYTRTPYLALS